MDLGNFQDPPSLRITMDVFSSTLSSYSGWVQAAYARNQVAVFAEFLGTFIFLSGVLGAVRQGRNVPMKVGLSLFAACNIVGRASGAHLNPAITGMLYMSGRFASQSKDLAAAYIVAQTVGGVSALLAYQAMNGVDVIKARNTANVFRGCLGEFFGTFILCSGVLGGGVGTEQRVSTARSAAGGADVDRRSGDRRQRERRAHEPFAHLHARGHGRRGRLQGRVLCRGANDGGSRGCCLRSVSGTRVRGQEGGRAAEREIARVRSPA